MWDRDVLTFFIYLFILFFGSLFLPLPLFLQNDEREFASFNIL